MERSCDKSQGMRFEKGLLGLLKVRKTGEKALGRALFVSILNQMVSSATNFVLGFYLVRALTPAEFGMYGIGMSVSLYYYGIGNALFLTQMVVRVPDKAPEDRLPYAARMLTTVALFCLATILTALLVFVVGETWLVWLAQYAGLGLVISAASVAYLLKDFFIRHSYTVRRETWALVINITVAFSLAGLLLAHHYGVLKITLENALWFYAVSNMAGAMAGFMLVRLPLWTVQWKRLFEDARESWIGGRWELGINFTDLLQSQSYTLVTALFIGAAGVGYINAARLLIAPVILLRVSVSQVMLPRLVDMRNQNKRKMIRLGQYITAGILVVAICYSAALLLYLRDIVPTVLGLKFDQYDLIFSLTLVWCLVLAFQIIRLSAMEINRAMKEFRRIMFQYTGGAIVSILLSVAFIQLFGTPGAILGLSASEIMLSIIMWLTIVYGSESV